MADSLLHMRAKLAKRAVIFDDLEEWVVAEAIQAGWLETNPAMTNVVALGANGTGRVGDGHMTHVVGGALL